jgi:anti-sigma factor RsiW
MEQYSSDHSLRETNWQRRLTPAEEAELSAWLAAHPEAASDWQEELALTEALHRLPDVPVASNFTARVVAAALQEPATETRKRPWLELRNWSLARWLPRVAFGLVIGFAGFLSFQQLHEVQHQKIARSVSVLSEVASVPGPEALRDFEAIRVLDASPAADEELLRLFQ